MSTTRIGPVVTLADKRTGDKTVCECGSDSFQHVSDARIALDPGEQLFACVECDELYGIQLSAKEAS
jgi:hypothetical protein